ncbi:hypothetical protein GCM10008959_14080 [Deinococcus seoulensis]|uniref:Uncharacterized protein n=2 Tax=Deinococcus seoulensis TaxID=1837379 RepID=A0ABQ2RT45_9DEIO|nr:hypothetical protein GCM10008959_14080 [Deinococcus seoulensis]
MGMKNRTRVKGTSGKFGLILAAAPVVLELLIKARQQQKKQGRYATARKRDRVIDTLLAGAQRAVGRRNRRRWF